MKAIFLLALLILLNTFGSYAQIIPAGKSRHDMLIRAGLGYATALPNHSYNPFSGDFNQQYIDHDLKNNVSFFSGVHIYLSGIYMFNKHIGIDLATDACIVPAKYVFKGEGPSLSGVGNIHNTQRSILPVMLTPSLLLKTARKSINVYLRTGVTVPIFSKVKETEDLEISRQMLFGDIIERRTIKAKPSLGFTCAAGLSFSISERLSLYTELSAIFMSMHVDKPGVDDNFSGLSIIYTNTHFPIHFTMPFSNIGINAGLSFKL